MAEEISSGLGNENQGTQAQLNFRKRVLKQTHKNKEIFHVWKHGKQLSVTELVDNLNKLLSAHSIQSFHHVGR